jgi:hypothetical protein
LPLKGASATNAGYSEAMSRENVEAVRRSADGWNCGDFDAWLQSPHPEIEFISEIARRVEGAETVWRGTEGMRRFWDESIRCGI